MDAEETAWLADLIQATLIDIVHRPGLTIEIDDHAEQWVQLIPEVAPVTEGAALGYILNFPLRLELDVATPFFELLSLPSGAQLVEKKRGSYATLWIPRDLSLLLLAKLCQEILTKIVGASTQASINIQIEHGL